MTGAHDDAGGRGGPPRSDDRLLRGRALLREVLEAYRPLRPAVLAAGRQVAIVRFDPAENASEDWRLRMEASAVSARQKVKAMTALGYGTHDLALPETVSDATFAATLSDWSRRPEVSAVIVQFPPPARLRQLVEHIEPSRDIDALLGPSSPYPACATADGVVRLVDAYRQPETDVAVVGSRGFVGAGVVRLLRSRGLQPLELDQGDDLQRLRGADIIISAAGRPGLLGPQELQHRPLLVVDTGFTPPGAGSVAPRGDVARSAYELPRHLTPVPGGVGPVEMAVLLERLVRRDLQPTLAPWRYTPERDRVVSLEPLPGRAARNTPPRSPSSGAPTQPRPAPAPPPSRPRPTRGEDRER